MTAFSSLYGERLHRELATDDTTQLFTTARRKAAINEGIEQFAELTECYTRTSTLTLTSTAAEWDLGSTAVIPDGDFVRLSREPVRVVYVDASSQTQILVGPDLPQRTVEYLDANEPGWRTSVASTTMQLPSCYYERLDGGVRYLGFYPWPSTGSSATMTAVIPYVARPTPITSDTQEPFTVNGAVRADLRPYHQAVVHYAAHVLEKLRRDSDASGAQLQQFLNYVTRVMAITRIKQGSVIGSVRSYFRGRNSDRGSDPRT